MTVDDDGDRCAVVDGPAKWSRIAGENTCGDPRGVSIVIAHPASRVLGLIAFETETDVALVDELLAILALVETDMTLFFRKLALIDVDIDRLHDMTDENLMAPLMEAYYQPMQLTPAYKERIGQWLRNYLVRSYRDDSTHEDRCANMNAVNPKYVLRNYLAQLAIDKAEQGDFSLVNELLEILRHPYDEQPGKEAFAEKRPDWARDRAGCSMLSCSS